ncbi:hypothetical protein VTK73DRAFT_1099 [Phialemonium thermophilum]|uniref:Uncharacterized protein n=1 Tax=Phialemonium thermophilum TaxID=223376 RepID=A0ABR3VTV8_9PEZI
MHQTQCHVVQAREKSPRPHPMLSKQAEFRRGNGGECCSLLRGITRPFANGTGTKELFPCSAYAAGDMATMMEFRIVRQAPTEAIVKEASATLPATPKAE